MIPARNTYSDDSDCGCTGSTKSADSVWNLESIKNAVKDNYIVDEHTGSAVFCVVS